MRQVGHLHDAVSNESEFQRYHGGEGLGDPLRIDYHQVVQPFILITEVDEGAQVVKELGGGEDVALADVAIEGHRAVVREVEGGRIEGLLCAHELLLQSQERESDPIGHVVLVQRDPDDLLLQVGNTRILRKKLI